VLDTPWSFISAFEGADTLSGPPMSLRPARNMSFGRWLLVAGFSSVKNRNVSGPHLFPRVTTHAKKSLCLPRTVLHRAKKSMCNRSQFRTLFLPHRFMKIRPSHQRPVSVEFLTICRIAGSPKSEQNRKSCGTWTPSRSSAHTASNSIILCIALNSNRGPSEDLQRLLMDLGSVLTDP